MVYRGRIDAWVKATPYHPQKPLQLWNTSHSTTTFDICIILYSIDQYFIHNLSHSALVPACGKRRQNSQGYYDKKIHSDYYDRHFPLKISDRVSFELPKQKHKQSTENVSVFAIGRHSHDRNRHNVL
jgi:hypothetical protein